MRIAYFPQDGKASSIGWGELVVFSCVVPQLLHFLHLSLMVFLFLTSSVHLITLPTHSRWLKCCFVIPKSLSVLQVSGAMEKRIDEPERVGLLPSTTSCLEL